MRFTKEFKDYELIDAEGGERLERWGDIILVRPDPQIIWSLPRKNPLWDSPHAIYHRSNKGGGYWEQLKKVPDVWDIGYKNLRFNLKPMGFKHTGLFPEQSVNWDMMADMIRKANRPVSVLNLFAYTGGATLACLEAGASVTHVDASKGMVLWAKENARISGLAEKNVRWLVDDCMKFVRREIRRGNKYDAVVLDPPSYGRGPDGEVWKLEDQLGEMLSLIKQILSDEPLFVLLNSYTGGISPTITGFMMENYIGEGKGSVTTGEIGLKITDRNTVLPAGNSTVWTP